MSEIVLQPTHDYGGADEWEMRLFDVNEDDKDPFTPAFLTVGTFSWCVLEAANFISKNNAMQVRIVIERVM